MTTYTIFMHYYNDAIGQAVTNQTPCKWYPCLTEALEYDNTQTYDHTYLKLSDMDENKIKKNEEALEILYMSSNNPTTSTNTSKYEELVVSSSTILNNKYDMIFIYDGLGYFTNDEDPSDVDHYNQLYFDKMKRINIRPWFFHSTYHSLNAAMSKAKELVDLFGKDHILIGKEVALDQYIDIV